MPGNFTYSPTLGTILGAGTHTLTATFTPKGKRYAPVTTTRALLVGQATPKVQWPAPKPVAGGTPLSELQLNAAANVPGAFTYSPTAGTVLSPGVQVLSALFTPGDPADYETQTVEVFLRVR